MQSRCIIHCIHWFCCLERISSIGNSASLDQLDHGFFSIIGFSNWTTNPWITWSTSIFKRWVHYFKKDGQTSSFNGSLVDHSCLQCCLCRRILLPRAKCCPSFQLVRQICLSGKIIRLGWCHSSMGLVLPLIWSQQINDKCLQHIYCYANIQPHLLQENPWWAQHFRRHP